MTIYTEGQTAGDWLMFEGQSLYSRTAGVLASGAKHESGTVLGKVTATDELVPWDPNASDGSETVEGILVSTVNATDAPKPCVIIDTFALINRSGLTFGAGVTTQTQRDDAIAELRALGIKAA